MSEGANGQGPAPADEFDRALRELTEGRTQGPRFHEPSAAERAKDAADRAKQARKDAAKSAKLAVRNARRQLGDRRHRGLLAGSLVLVVLVLAGGLAWMRLGRTAGGAADLQTVSTHSPTKTVTGPATGPMPILAPKDLYNQPGDDPFYGTQADAWASGAAGIAAPKARAVGPFTAAQVTAAYATTRKLLIAAALDRHTLLGGSPAAFARLLSSRQRADFLASLNDNGLDKSGKERNLRSWVASFAPGGTALIGSVIKVRGSMSAGLAGDQGRKALAVTVDYRFVYAVEPPGDPASWMRVIAHFAGTVEFAQPAGASAAMTPLVAWSQSDAGTSCDSSDGYIHPAYQNGVPDASTTSGSTIDPYAAHVHTASSRCWSVSRT